MVCVEASVITLTRSIDSQGAVFTRYEVGGSSLLSLRLVWVSVRAIRKVCHLLPLILQRTPAERFRLLGEVGRAYLVQLQILSAPFD